MKKLKSVLILAILFVVFLLGYMTSSLIKKDVVDENEITSTEVLIDRYSALPESIDSIEKLSICYYDTANIEMLHYMLEYNDKNVTTDYYISKFGDTIEYNKENFYKYIALYIVAENLLETRKHIINGLIIDNEIYKKNRIKQKVED
jgi:hypothetical protein